MRKSEYIKKSNTMLAIFFICMILGGILGLVHGETRFERNMYFIVGSIIGVIIIWGIWPSAFRKNKK